MYSVGTLRSHYWRYLQIFLAHNIITNTKCSETNNSTSHSTQPTLENATQPNAINPWMDPTHVHLWSRGPSQRRRLAWLGSRVVSVLDSGGAVGPEFKAQPRRCRATALGKLFICTHCASVHQGKGKGSPYSITERRVPEQSVCR